jgi:hypothetical protein
MRKGHFAENIAPAGGYRLLLNIVCLSGLCSRPRKNLRRHS